MTVRMLECVVNISEGRDLRLVETIASAAGPYVLDVHSDADHHRSVLTLCGPADEVADAASDLARTSVSLLDLRRHSGAHPRFGVLDVVPWVPLSTGTGGRLFDGEPERGVAARDAFARRTARDLELPCYLYGPERSLPDLRRALKVADREGRPLAPDFGPARPHPSAGRSAVGARPVLVAYNLWLAADDLTLARRVAGEVRTNELRTLGLPVGRHVQVSFNLVDPFTAGPGRAFDSVARRTDIERAELVGLVPRAVLDAEPQHRWAELGLSEDCTIEARLEKAGLDGGRFGTAIS